MKSRWTRSAAVVVAALATGGCVLFPRKAATPSDSATMAPLKAADARLAKMSFSRMKVHRGLELYDYMDGAADAYLARGLRALVTADTRWRDTSAKIELFELDSASNAKALFADMNDAESRKLTAGEDGASWVWKESEGVFHRGPYFCRILVYGNDAKAGELLAMLAGAIDESLRSRPPRY